MRVIRQAGGRQVGWREGRASTVKLGVWCPTGTRSVLVTTHEALGEPARRGRERRRVGPAVRLDGPDLAAPACDNAAPALAPACVPAHQQASEQCDGSDSKTCPGLCRSDCTCRACQDAQSWVTLKQVSGGNNIQYGGVVGLGIPNGTLKSVSLPPGGDYGIVFVKPGYTTDDCYVNADAVVTLAPGQTASASSIEGQDTALPVALVACWFPFVSYPYQNPPPSLGFTMTYTYCQ